MDGFSKPNRSLVRLVPVFRRNIRHTELLPCEAGCRIRCDFGSCIVLVCKQRPGKSPGAAFMRSLLCVPVQRFQVEAHRAKAIVSENHCVLGILHPGQQKAALTGQGLPVENPLPAYHTMCCPIPMRVQVRSQHKSWNPATVPVAPHPESHGPCTLHSADQL